MGIIVIGIIILSLITAILSLKLPSCIDSDNYRDHTWYIKDNEEEGRCIHCKRSENDYIDWNPHH